LYAEFVTRTGGKFEDMRRARGETAHTNVTFRPLTADLWPALEDVLGETGARGCWCMYWRIGAKYSQRPADENRAGFRAVVDEGPPPGLIAFAGDVPVGWCQVTPREDVPMLDRAWRLKRVDDLPVWSISCLYVRKGYRRRGITDALVAQAVETARRAGAPAVEAYPFDAQVSPSASGTGYASVFERAGFTTVARRVPARPVMRLRLDSHSPASPGSGDSGTPS
jgi:GNAT superfamily N-acetyltransferase